MLRLITSVVGGLLFAFAIVFAADAAFHAFSPALTHASDPSDPEAMRLYVANQPAGVLIALLLGWSVAVFTGSAIASRFGGRRELPGWLVTGLFLLATLFNFTMVQHPTWMASAGIAGILLAGWSGARLMAKPAQLGSAASRR
jgi:hypothetical protein